MPDEIIQKINLLIARTVNDKSKQRPCHRGGQIDIIIKLAEITGFPLETLNRHITKKEEKK